MLIYSVIETIEGKPSIQSFPTLELAELHMRRILIEAGMSAVDAIEHTADEAWASEEDDYRIDLVEHEVRKP